MYPAHNPDDRPNFLPPGGRFGYAILVANLDKGNPSEFSWLKDLNPQQQTAAKASKGPVLVVAGAGTGKTKTLAYHVAHLVCAGIDPGRIMLLTFTRRAAEEMIRCSRRNFTIGPGHRRCRAN
jgi:hypothetical protein